MEELIEEPTITNTNKRSEQHKPIPVPHHTIDSLTQLSQNLVQIRNQLTHTQPTPHKAITQLNTLTTKLHKTITNTTQSHIGNLWLKLIPSIKELTSQTNKQIQLKITNLNKSINTNSIQTLKTQLTNILTNIIENSLETPDDRINKNKPPTCTIELKTYDIGTQTIIEITDDGIGIQPETHLIHNTNSPHTININSKPQTGTHCTITIPPSSPIISILQVKTHNQILGITQNNITEIIKPTPNSHSTIELLNNHPVIRHRNQLLPLIHLSEPLNLTTSTQTQNSQLHEEHILICTVNNYSFGIIIDEILSLCEVILQPLPTLIQTPKIYAGSAILGDDTIALILDTNEIAKIINSSNYQTNPSLPPEHKTNKPDNYTSFIIFKTNDPTPNAVPLHLVSHVGEIDASKLEFQNGKPFIQHDNKLMHIITINSTIPNQGSLEFLAFNNKDQTLGIIVDNIIDIAKSNTNNQHSNTNQGTLGTTTINNQTCNIIDINYYFRKTFNTPYTTQITPQTNTNHTTNKNVLFIDNSPFFRKFIPPTLHSNGYTVTTCQNATEALTHIKNGQQFTAILTDINLPDINGTSFLSLYKQNTPHNQAPVIALTSNITTNKTSTNNQFHSYILKTNHKQLLSTLTQISNSEDIQ